MKKIVKIFLVSGLVLMMGALLPKLQAKADNPNVLGQFYYQKTDGTTAYVEMDLTGADISVSCRDFYDTYMDAQIGSLPDLETTGLYAWTCYPTTYGKSYATEESTDMSFKDMVNSYTNTVYISYYALYSDREWAYFGYEVTYGTDDQGETVYLDSGTGYDFLKVAGEDQHDAIVASAKNWYWLKDWLSAYDGVTYLYRAGEDGYQDYYILDIAVPVVEGETVISPTESLVVELDGSERRQVRSEDSVEIILKGDTGIVPTGAGFHSSYLNSGDIYDQAVATVYTNFNATKTLAVLEFDLLDAGEDAITELEDYVEVTLPIPDIFENGADLKVYRVEGDTLVACDTTVEDGMIIFRTNHFSIYVVVDETPEVVEEPEAEETQAEAESVTTVPETDSAEKVESADVTSEAVNTTTDAAVNTDEGSGVSPVVWIIIAVAVIACVIVVVVLVRKKKE